MTDLDSSVHLHSPCIFLAAKIQEGFSRSFNFCNSRVFISGSRPQWNSIGIDVSFQGRSGDRFRIQGRWRAMHGSQGEIWKHRRHMRPVLPNATTVAPTADSSTSELVCQDGRKIHVGDCALFKPPQDSPPFIGIIRKLTLKKDKNPSLGVNWLYRPVDVKLGKGILPEAAPNEVFYSFHKDEIPAASLLHPCKVAFLRKGVELPSGISAFVCRRVYDTENECLWWLTDKDFINERQEEVDQLLDKTRLEMHGTVQSGGRSPQPLNAPSSTPSLKSGADNSVQNSSFIGAQGKGKKRERVDQVSDSSNKRERAAKTDDGDSGHFRPESLLKSEISKITDKGGLVNFEGVERLVQLMQPDSADKKIDLAERIMLVDVLAVTDRFDCLGWFVQLRGLPVLDEWLQEVHKGKIGDGSIPKESDKSVEEFLLALLRALDKLPVNLHALQTCNVGKSVNHLRTHKNSEIQKKARSLVDTWKRRVEAEMNLNDSKSGWPAKPAPSDVSHVGNRKAGGTLEIAANNSTMQPSVSKNSQPKINYGEALPKSSPTPSSSKSVTPSVGTNSKDQNFKTSVGAGTSDLPSIKEARSSSSSQSQTNSLSSCREDARSSTAVSLNPMKTPVCLSQSQYNSISLSPMRIPGSSSWHQKSSNGLHGLAVNAVQKELSSGKNSGRNSPSGKVSPTQTSHEKLPETPFNDHGNNQRLIVRLSNASRSPASGASGGSFEDHVVPCGEASPPGDKHDNQDRRMKVKTYSLQSNDVLNMTSDVCDADEPLPGYEESNGSPTGDEQCRVNDDGDKMAETPKPASSSPGFVSRSGKAYDASLSSINALIESCVQFSEAAGASIPPGDDVGMNLLATVAAGEISRSENASPMASPERKSLMVDEPCSGIDWKSKHSGEAVAYSVVQSDGLDAGENVNTAEAVRFMNDTKCPVTLVSCNMSRDGDVTSTSCTGKTEDGRTLFNSSTADLLQNAKCPSLRPDMKGDSSESILSAKKEVMAEHEGVQQAHKQRESEIHSKLNARASTENDSTLLPEGACAGVKIEGEANAKSLESTSDVGNMNQVRVEKVTDTSISVQKPSTLAESCESKGGTDKDVILPTALSDAVMGSKPGNSDDMKPCEIEHNEGQMDPVSSISASIHECAGGKSDRKDVLGHYSGSSVHSESLGIPMQENDMQKSSGCNLDQGESEEAAGDRHASSVNASHTAAGSDTDVKLDFDLNEGFPVDDVNQAEIVSQEEPITSFAVHTPCPFPFPLSSMSAGFQVSVTLASAAKGPVVPPENPLWSKGKLGWKGSAATSAFRPAEPRKTVEQPSNTSEMPSADTTAAKQGRPPLDFDLNVPDQRSFEDVASHGSSGKTCLGSGPHDHRNAGLDLDLNRVDETPDAGSFSISKLDIPPLPNKPSLSGGLSNGGSVSRDFDLNDGPGLDEVGPETPACSQQIKSSVPFPSAANGVRPSNTEFGNHSSWFASGNSHCAITVPPLLPGRGDQNFVAGAGAHRILGPAGSTSFGPEIYRGPVLPSSPAVAYPPTTPFQYPGFPFETNFPLPSNSFSGCSTPFMDSSSAGGLCFPTMPSQLLGPGGVVQSTYSPRPFVMSFQGGTSNVIPESRKWGSQSLDLNSGPGGAESERRDDRLPSGVRPLSAPNTQSLMEEHMKMYQVAGVLKRKEPDGGWDGADRFNYKQLSWQ